MEGSAITVKYELLGNYRLKEWGNPIENGLDSSYLVLRAAIPDLKSTPSEGVIAIPTGIRVFIPEGMIGLVTLAGAMWSRGFNAIPILYYPINEEPVFVRLRNMLSHNILTNPGEIIGYMHFVARPTIKLEEVLEPDFYE